MMFESTAQDFLWEIMFGCTTQLARKDTVPSLQQDWDGPYVIIKPHWEVYQYSQIWTKTPCPSEEAGAPRTAYRSLEDYKIMWQTTDAFFKRHTQAQTQNL